MVLVESTTAERGQTELIWLGVQKDHGQNPRKRAECNRGKLLNIDTNNPDGSRSRRSFSQEIEENTLIQGRRQLGRLRQIRCVVGQEVTIYTVGHKNVPLLFL